MAESAASNEAYQRRSSLFNRRTEIDTLQTELFGVIAQHGYDDSSTFAIRLALEEALANAFKHGNRNNPDAPVTIDLCVDQNQIVIDVEDQGTGFDPNTVPDPTEDENVEIPSGRGLTLMRAFMTEVHIHPPGNRVTMTYQRPGE